MKNKETLEELEEAALKYNEQFIGGQESRYAAEDFINGARWQQERSYSEEEFRNKLYECLGYFAYKHNIKINGTELDSWCYENLKK
jgi:hypothetical protein